MKQFLTYLLITTFLALNIKDGVYFAYFKINQSEIVQEFCVNKDTDCHASCHLAQKVGESAEAEDLPENIEELVRIDLIDEGISIIDLMNNERFALHYHFTFNYYKENTFDVFHPPCPVA